MSGADGSRAPRLRLDPVRCDGAGYCAEIVPELVGLDDWGFPIVDRAEIVEAKLLRMASRAVSQCPRAALVLTTDAERR